MLILKLIEIVYLNLASKRSELKKSPCDAAKFECSIHICRVLYSYLYRSVLFISETAPRTTTRHTQVTHFAPLSVASDCAMQGRAQSRPETAPHTAIAHGLTPWASIARENLNSNSSMVKGTTGGGLAKIGFINRENLGREHLAPPQATGKGTL